MKNQNEELISNMAILSQRLPDLEKNNKELKDENEILVERNKELKRLLEHRNADLKHS